MARNTEPLEHCGDDEVYAETYTLEADFQVMRGAVKLRRKVQTIEKIALFLKFIGQTTYPPIHNLAHPKKLATASPANQMDVKKPSLLLLFVHQVENSLEFSTSHEKTYVLTPSGKKSMRKVRSESKLASKLTVVLMF